jgi:hypothetical protein
MGKFTTDQLYGMMIADNDKRKSHLQHKRRMFPEKYITKKHVSYKNGNAIIQAWLLYDTEEYMYELRVHCDKFKVRKVGKSESNFETYMNNNESLECIIEDYIKSKYSRI